MLIYVFLCEIVIVFSLLWCLLLLRLFIVQDMKTILFKIDNLGSESSTQNHLLLIWLVYFFKSGLISLEQWFNGDGTKITTVIVTSSDIRNNSWWIFTCIWFQNMERSMKMLLGGMPISSKRWLLILLSKVVQSYGLFF